MFKMLTQLFDTDEAAVQGATPTYRCDLITDLRSDYKALVSGIEQITANDLLAGKQVERLDAAFRRYTRQETTELYPFLEYYSKHFNTTHEGLICDRRKATRELGQRLNQVIARTWYGVAEFEELLAVQNMLRAHFQQQQASVYPLYHRFGIQLLRIVF